jgi:putative phosphoesterase
MIQQINTQEHLVGVISDTHGWLSPQAIEALQGAELIIHAGDIDTFEVLRQLNQIAPVRAVCGNMDRGPWTKDLPKTDVVQVGETMLYVLHRLEDLEINPSAAGFHAVIYGHYHKPEIKIRNGILFLNPGSARYSRHDKYPSLALLRIQGLSLKAEIKSLYV